MKRHREIDKFFLSKEEPPSKKQKTDHEKEKVWPDWVLEADQGVKPFIKKFPPITVSPLPPEAYRRPGKIRVLKIYIGSSVGDPHVPGYTNYHVCKNRSAYHTVSPMLLGPVLDDNNKEYALNIEDGWQCSKVWPFHFVDGDKNDDWLENWCEWSRRGRFSGLAKRHRTPKSTGKKQETDEINPNKPLFSYYQGKRMSYGEARKVMYCRWYAQLAVETDAFKDLYARYQSGEKMVLLDYDGLDRNNADQNVDLTPEKLRELIEDDSRPFGHGLVLACLLLNCHVWL